MKTEEEIKERLIFVQGQKDGALTYGLQLEKFDEVKLKSIIETLEWVLRCGE